MPRYVPLLMMTTGVEGGLKVSGQRFMDKSPLINGWPLFWWLALVPTGFMVRASLLTDLSSPDGISAMIQYSVRWAVPLIFLITATSAVARLFPSTVTRWLLRNRRYVGLAFATAMAWQGAFIFWISVGHPEHYYSNIYFLRDELEGSSGYLFLMAMIVTSFPFGRRYLSAAHWRVLHRSGVYFLWAYPFSVYWWNTAYYGSDLWLDYLFYGLGFTAFALRIAAWGKNRRQPQQNISGYAVGGTLLVAGGLLLAMTGSLWQKSVSAFLLAPSSSQTLELWLPFWPFQPFLPLLLLGLGTWLLTLNKESEPSKAQVAA
jgi:hypothetical protein